LRRLAGDVDLTRRAGPGGPARTRGAAKRALLHFAVGFRELFVFHWNVVLHLGDLNGEAAVGAREGPAERNFYAIHGAIVRIINLRRIPAERRFAITPLPQEQPRLGFEIEPDWRAAGPCADQRLALYSIDCLRTSSS